MNYSFMEAKIAFESFLYYNMQGKSQPEHKELIRQNSGKLRVVEYTHQFPDGSESICYHIQGYVPLEKVFRKRQLNFEELVLLLYGVVHTVSNAKKCGLNPDSFVLDPRYVYLSHNSIQPYLIYLPDRLAITLRDEFLALLNFLDGAVDSAVPNTKKLVAVLKNITAHDFDMETIINIVVRAANTNEVPELPAPQTAPAASVPAASPPMASGSAASPLGASPPGASQPVSPPGAPPPPVPAQPKIAAPAAQTASAAQTAPPAPKPLPAPRASAKSARPAPPAPKKGFFARIFGKAAKDEAPEEYLPEIDDRTMLDFTAYGEGEGQPMLYVVDDGVRLEQIPITNKAFVLGRNPAEADHCFTDKGISRVHAAIIYDGSNYFLLDKGSSGGTFVNGDRLTPNQSAPIKHGDVIALYSKRLLFEVE